ncbi:flagellar basal-body rod protein FlgF [Sphingomonas solaris]|uniref:Flagellar basal-body rod protein FlgF n=1 Tax=Alterirhizorhabdus solaris TaxID=2529389 RepID=A0A558QUU6_9SPHN|nr:flagellar basal-body rod protein FlgF [Sphingomonas solaris]TVV70926.1 flagellar basal-body rod protein FlgF [Sphingomonas solaris]
MDRLIHTALSAMRGAMARQTTTANNLANANTAGFRAELASVRPLWITGEGFGSRAPSSEEVTSADMSAGAVTATGRDLDVAIDGDALLGVQGDDGEEAYTRRGDLAVSDSGLLTTGDGHPVLGEGGPITLPPYDKLNIAADGSIFIVPQGADAAAEPQLVDRLKLASPTGTQIAKSLDGLFRVKGGGALPADPDAKVTAGSIEGSNVNTSTALVDMIDASRSWDTQVRLLTTAKELDTASADLMRLPD